MINDSVSPFIFRVFTALFSVFLITGCSQELENAVRQRRENLELIGKSYLQWYEVKQASPANADEFTQWMLESDDANTRGSARDSIVEGDVIMIWSGELADASANDGYVLAFEAPVPAKGGYVVMGDASVTSMTAKEFAAATMLPRPNEE